MAREIKSRLTPPAGPVPAPNVGLVVDVPVPGGLDALLIREQPIPSPKPDEVLIQVRAAGVNRGDIKQREGDYPMAGLQVTSVLGLEVAGVVVAVGAEVTGIKPGENVCALLTGGGYAQYCVAPALQCLRIPQGLDFVAAAALPETFFTVWLALYEQAKLKAGEALLVQGGASGIGTTAIQIASALGARVLATAGSGAKCEACIAAGAELAINYREEEFAERILSHTGGEGIDVVLDMVGGPYASRHVRVLREGGRLCYVAGDHGPEAVFNIRAIMLKRLSITGVTLRHRSVAEKADIALQLQRHVWPLIESGRIRPVVGQVIPIEEVKEAHRALASGAIIGKAVLKVG